LDFPFTDDRIREFLDNLGLPQVDPAEFRISTLPELLRANMDLGRLAPRPQLSFPLVLTFTSGNNTNQLFDITGANAGQIRIASHMQINVTTANIGTIRLEFNDGGVVFTRLWDDTGTPLFPVGAYIGTANEATRAWGAQGLSNIHLYPPEMTGGIQRQVAIRLLSAAPEIKTVAVRLTVVQFNAADWLPGQM